MCFRVCRRTIGLAIPILLASAWGVLGSACASAPAPASAAASGEAWPQLEVGAPVDLDATCGTTVEGLVYSYGYVSSEYEEDDSAAVALWFTQHPLEPLPPELEEYPGDLEPEAGAAPMVLLSPPARLLGSVVRHAGSPRAFALAGPDPETGHFGLVHLAAGDLAVSPWWSEAGRPLLLGRIGNAAIVMLRDAPAVGGGSVRVLAVPEADGEASPDTVRFVDAPAAATFRELPVGDATTPLVVPLDPDSFAFRCDGGKLCVVRVEGGAPMLEQVSLPVTALDWPATSPSALAQLEDGSCIELLGPASDWPARPRVACPDYIGEFSDPGLPVDGIWQQGAWLPVDGCLVRDRLAPLDLDAVHSLRVAEDALYTEGVGIAPGMLVVGPRSVGFGALDVDLIIPLGYNLSVGYVDTEDEGPHARRSWGIAMPPGSVQAWSARIGDIPALYLRIRAPIAFNEHFYHECTQGWLVLALEWPWTGEVLAVSNIYQEFGFCE